MITKAHGPDEECASCHGCPCCSGADGSIPKRAEIRVADGVARMVCLQCRGSGVQCPNYALTSYNVRESA